MVVGYSGDRVATIGVGGNCQKLAGIVGALLAVPIASAGMEFIEDMEKKKRFARLAMEEIKNGLEDLKILYDENCNKLKI